MHLPVVKPVIIWTRTLVQHWLLISVYAIYAIYKRDQQFESRWTIAVHNILNQIQMKHFYCWRTGNSTIVILSVVKCDTAESRELQVSAISIYKKKKISEDSSEYTGHRQHFKTHLSICNNFNLTVNAVQVHT